MLHSFARCELAPAELALPLWDALGSLFSGFPAFPPRCAVPPPCKSLLLLLGLGCYPCALSEIKKGLVALPIEKL
jgi:hypothetical protein